MLIFAPGKPVPFTALEPATVMVLGGEPVGERFIEWNFVSSSKERIDQAKDDRRAGRMKLPRSTTRIHTAAAGARHGSAAAAESGKMIEVERVQTGVRIEKRLLKVLKGLAELKELSLGDLLEGIVLHAFEGKAPFSPETLAQIAELNKIYGMSFRAGDSHRLREKNNRQADHGNASHATGFRTPSSQVPWCARGGRRRRGALDLRGVLRALRRMGSGAEQRSGRKGDRVATIAPNTHQHLEQFYAIPAVRRRDRAHELPPRRGRLRRT